MNNIALAKLLKEQEGLMKFKYKIRIEDGEGNRRTMAIHANTALLARKMANEQLNPGDRIIWVKLAPIQEPALFA